MRYAKPGRANRSSTFGGPKLRGRRPAGCEQAQCQHLERPRLPPAATSPAEANAARKKGVCIILPSQVDGPFGICLPFASSPPPVGRCRVGLGRCWPALLTSSSPSPLSPGSPPSPHLRPQSPLDPPLSMSSRTVILPAFRFRRPIHLASSRQAAIGWATPSSPPLRASTSTPAVVNPPAAVLGRPSKPAPAGPIQTLIASGSQRDILPGSWGLTVGAVRAPALEQFWRELLDGTRSADVRIEWARACDGPSPWTSTAVRGGRKAAKGFGLA
jgi:hypothetical protein